MSKSQVSGNSTKYQVIMKCIQTWSQDGSPSHPTHPNTEEHRQTSQTDFRSSSTQLYSCNAQITTTCNSASKQ